MTSETKKIIGWFIACIAFIWMVSKADQWTLWFMDSYPNASAFIYHHVFWSIWLTTCLIILIAAIWMQDWLICLAVPIIFVWLQCTLMISFGIGIAIAMMTIYIFLRHHIRRGNETEKTERRVNTQPA